MKTFERQFNSFKDASGWRFNPLPNLTPTRLAKCLDDFDAGYLTETAAIFELLEQRDDLLRGVVSKRKKSVARHGWVVVEAENLSSEDKRRAGEHREVLEFFYNNLECEHATDRAAKGGFKLLARQMMDAVGKRFAVHEIVWKTETGGSNRRLVTAKFRFVPLGFFENRTGALRFLADPFSMEGVALEPGAWMVTTGEGLMAASATAWMFKHISLNDWLRACQRNGTPTLVGVSSAGEGTEARTNFEQALENLLQTRTSAVIGTADNIRVLDLMGGGHLPFPELVERVDRLMATLWRGADLSTLSRDRGYGASLQEKETCALEEDDAEMLTETLNRYVDEWVIKHAFGPEEKPLARVKILVSPRECTQDDLRVDEFLLKHGAPLEIEETMRRYGRAMPKAGQRIFGQEKGRQGSSSGASLPASSHPMENDGGQPVVNSRGCPLRAPQVAAELCEAEAADEARKEQEAQISGQTEGLSNRFELLQEEWLQLAPYGEFPHSRGLQRVDRAAAQGMVEQFHSLRGRAGRLFGGAPFYVGHPDLPGATEAADRKAYGWVEDLEAREEGLFGRVKWSEAGLELLRNGHFKFLSPFWEARAIGVENGKRVYRPVALVSVGLTNQPNIPVRPLANEAPAPQPVEAGPAIRSASVTEGLGKRKAELMRMANRADRIQECVMERMRQGLGYDEAWARVKREHQGWFEGA